MSLFNRKIRKPIQFRSVREWNKIFGVKLSLAASNKVCFLAFGSCPFKLQWTPVDLIDFEHDGNSLVNK